MTDQQIVNFIEYRAKKNGLEHKLYNPKLILYVGNNRFPFIGIKYENNDNVFFLRFWRNNIRAMFKIDFNIDGLCIEDWIAEKFKQKNGYIEYDLDSIPKNFVHYVSYAIIDALKRDNTGLDMFSYNLYGVEIKLIDPNETYEEASIETDLMCGLI